MIEVRLAKIDYFGLPWYTDTPYWYTYIKKLYDRSVIGSIDYYGLPRNTDAPYWSTYIVKSMIDVQLATLIIMDL